MVARPHGMGKVRGSSPLGSTFNFMKKKKNKIILFDFDGVIVSSCQLAFEINKEMILGLKCEEFQSWQEGNIFKYKMKHNQENKHKYYFKKYKEKIYELLPVAGMKNLFENLLKMDYRLIVVSSAKGKDIGTFLKKYSLEKYFVEIMGCEIDRSKVKKFEMVFKKYKIKVKETLIVTDSVGDVREAGEVNMKSIGVVWGIHEKEKLIKNGANFVAERPKDILVGIKKTLALN